MDVGIVNAKEMLSIDDLDDDMRVLCENLVFNKTPEATEDMLTRTAYERECIDAKKKGLPPPRKPRGKVQNLERLKFSYDNVEPKPATEPPIP
eukprot:scaffold9670_cov117-Cylindrotheca_fusiformis.AAC.1